MKTPFIRLVSIFALLACALIGHAADPVGQTDDQDAIRKLISGFGGAFAKLDAHAFSMVFHEDADFTNVWGMAAHGRKAIEEFHRPLLEGDGTSPVPSFKHAEFKVLETKIRFLRPDVAFADVTWSQTGAVQNGRDMGPRKGLLMLVMTKDANVWGIAVMHYMDLPVPT